MVDDRTPRPSESQVRALIEVVAIVAFADGALVDSEREVVTRRVRELPGVDLEPGAIADLLTELRPPRRPEGDARARCLNELGKVLGDDRLRLEAFSIAMEVAKADSRVGVREASSLAAAAQELGLELKVALELLGNGLTGA